jgi:non-specific protein-tyrosine kinase
MTDKMDKAIAFFRKGQTSEKMDVSEMPETSQSNQEVKDKKAPVIPLQNNQVRAGKAALSFLAGRTKAVKDKEEPEIPLRNNQEQKVKKALSFLDRVIEKVSALFQARRLAPANAAPIQKDAVQKGKKVLSLLARVTEKASALLAARGKPPANAAPMGVETEDEASFRKSLSAKGNGDSKEKAGWLSPDYSQSRPACLNPEFILENRCLAYLDSISGSEAYRVLRTQVLQRTRGSGSNTIMITSALPGEGKTLAAINLAFTFAREFQHTVLLVDGDLRKQSIHKYLGCAGEKGLIDYLVDGSPVSELITWPGIEKMTLISGGRPFHESAEILGSPRMKELIVDMKKRYPERYIIFDVPPILTGADVLTLAPLVDQVIVVVRAGSTSMDDVKKALQFLPKEKILGLVLNRKN